METKPRTTLRVMGAISVIALFVLIATTIALLKNPTPTVIVSYYKYGLIILVVFVLWIPPALYLRGRVDGYQQGNRVASDFLGAKLAAAQTSLVKAEETAQAQNGRIAELLTENGRLRIDNANLRAALGQQIEAEMAPIGEQPDSGTLGILVIALSPASVAASATNPPNRP